MLGHILVLLALAPQASEDWPSLDELKTNRVAEEIKLPKPPEKTAPAAGVLPQSAAETTEKADPKVTPPSDKSDDTDETDDEADLAKARESAKQKKQAAKDEPSPKKKERVALEAHSEPEEWTKTFGQMLVRRSKDRLFIKAGDTMIVLDQSGKVVIQAADTLNIETKKDLLFKAGGDIRLEAGNRVVTSGGAP